MAFDLSNLSVKPSEEKPASHRGGASAADPTTNPLYQPFQNSVNNGKGAAGSWEGQSQTFVIPDDDDAEKSARRAVAKAAKDSGYGYRFRTRPVNGGREVIFWAVELPESNGTAECPRCAQEVSITADSELRVHGPRDNRCEGSGLAVSVPA